MFIHWVCKHLNFLLSILDLGSQGYTEEIFKISLLSVLWFSLNCQTVIVVNCILVRHTEIQFTKNKVHPLQCGEENGNPPQYSCLENPMDGGAWWATIRGSQRVGHDGLTLYCTVLEF